MLNVWAVWQWVWSEPCGTRLANCNRERRSIARSFNIAALTALSSAASSPARLLLSFHSQRASARPMDDRLARRFLRDFGLPPYKELDCCCVPSSWATA